jgi:hypothetical protein
MNAKDLIAVGKELFGFATKTVGTIAIGLFLLSLYPPLSFVPKAFLLFVLTH